MNSPEQKLWESVYSQKAPDEVSWYRSHLDESLRFLNSAQLEPSASIIDVGGGASSFVDDVLERGYSNVTVLDLSATALEAARERLGARASGIQWVCADVTLADLPENAYDFWHDRAVFHFLVDPAARTRYVDTLRKAVKSGGHVVIATFGPNGPRKCSGLDVVRYTAEALHSELGDDFEKIAESTEIHKTPWGSDQEFVYCYCRSIKRI
jgi:SAM-dependent methyltransferase